MNPQGYPPPGAPQQPGYGYPQQPPPKKGRGCLIAALVSAGVGLVVAIVVIALLYKAAKTVGAVAMEGMNAPGTAELRASGCDVAMVMDMSKISSVFDAGSATAASSGSIVVACNVNPGHAKPSCDDVAATYVKAVGSANGSFMAQVQQQGAGQPECQKLYGPTGTFIRSMR
jgi:hypothetical protein